MEKEKYNLPSVPKERLPSRKINRDSGRKNSSQAYQETSSTKNSQSGCLGQIVLWVLIIGCSFLFVFLVNSTLSFFGITIKTFVKSIAENGVYKGLNLFLQILDAVSILVFGLGFFVIIKVLIRRN